MSTANQVDVPPLASPEQQHDAANTALGFRFVRALAVEKAVLDPRLAPKDIRVLAALSFHMNAKTMRAWPSYERISDIVGYTHEAIERAVKNLISCGYIFRERRAPFPGSRAMVHYGLRAVTFNDIDDVIAAAVAQIRNETGKSGRSRLTPLKKHGSVPLKRLESEPHPDHLIAAHSAQMNPQKPLADEPAKNRNGRDTVVSINIDERYLEEFARLFAVWGLEQSPSAKPADRKLTDGLLLSELSVHTAVSPAVLSVAFVAALNTASAKSYENSTSTIAPAAKGGGAMLAYFRKCLRSEIGNIQLSTATLAAKARSEQHVQEERLSHRVRTIQQQPPSRDRGRPSMDDLVAQAFNAQPGLAS